MAFRYLGRQILRPIVNSSKTTTRHDSTFNAAVLEAAGQPMKIISKKRPKLKSGQARIKVHSCAFNASDFLLAQGSNPLKLKLPVTPGYELSGEVLELKDCKDIGKGDKIVALNKDELGGFADECVVNEKDAWLAPNSLDMSSAAALTDSFGTAYLGLLRHGQLKEKQVILATFAPAHGYAALDLSANVYKAKVIGVATTEEEAESLRSRGAWSAVSYSEKNLNSVVSDLTKGKGVDIVYDTLAGDVLKSCLKCVAHEGHLIVAGFTMKELPQIQMSHFLTLPSFSMSGVSLMSYRKYAFDTYRKAVSTVIEMAEQNLIRPQIAKIFPLEDVNKALEFIQEKHPIGKVIVKVKK